MGIRDKTTVEETGPSKGKEPSTSSSIHKVKLLLQESAPKPKAKQSAVKEKAKLTHIASFICDKETGSIDLSDRKLTGTY